MNWTYSITTDKLPDGTGRLRYRVAFGRSRVAFSLGLRVDLSKWNSEAQRCKPNTSHGKKKIPANHINRTIQHYIDTTERLMLTYEANGTRPTDTTFRKDFNTALARTPDSSDKLCHIINRYVIQVSKENQWSQSTYSRNLNIGRKVETYYPELTIAEADNEFLANFTNILVYDEKLSNSTVKDYVKRLKIFLRWADLQGENVPPDYKTYSPRIQTIQKPVIFLTWDELMKVYNATLPTTYLTNTRDIFCFSCFTGLRYSDIVKLTPEDVKETYIEIVTQKTSDPLRIELNKYSRAILDKHHNTLPTISNQRFNDYIKEVGMICGIDTPIKKVTYKAGKRVETTQPKWRMLSSHAGRRTFISSALALGIPADVVMKWTGHKDYNAMRPYIDIANQVKQEMMNRFDNLGDVSPKK